MHSDREYKSVLNDKDKSTIQDTSGRALILHGGKIAEHNSLLDAGFRHAYIDSVEIDRARHEQFQQEAYVPLTNNAFRMDVHKFVRDYAFRYGYSYIHLDFNGCFVNQKNQRQIIETLQQLPELVKKNSPVRVRFTVSDYRTRNAGRPYASQEAEWMRNSLRWYLDNFLPNISKAQAMIPRSPSFLFYLSLVTTFSLGAKNNLSVLLKTPDKFSPNFGTDNRLVQTKHFETYRHIRNYDMHTCWFDIHPGPVHRSAIDFSIIGNLQEFLAENYRVGQGKKV